MHLFNYYTVITFFKYFLIYVILFFAFEGFVVPICLYVKCEVEKPGLFLEKWDV